MNKQDFIDLGNINFSLAVDDQIKQNGNTSMMLFSFDYIVSYLSRFITLKKGDLIFTGTPAGVGPISIGQKLTAFIENKKFLECEIK